MDTINSAAVTCSPFPLDEEAKAVSRESGGKRDQDLFFNSTPGQTRVVVLLHVLTASEI